MLGIFGTRADLLYDINLILQIAIFILLLAGRRFARDKVLRKHGLTMAAATALHTVLILSVMVPSFIRYFGVLVGYPFTLGVAITWIHAALGISVEALALFIVARWRFQTSTVACAKRKRLMKPLLWLWAAALVLGIGFYIYYYV